MTSSLNNSPATARRRLHAFTLVEILIVVVILGILATIAIPQFSSASNQAKENTLKDEMRYLRTQLAVYKAQHRDRSAGYPGGDVGSSPTEAALTAQLTTCTDELGNTSGTPSATYCYGPYLSQLPKNPLNGFATFLIVANGAAMPTPDGTTGFIYKPQTQELMPNLTGADSSGVSYANY